MRVRERERETETETECRNLMKLQEIKILFENFYKTKYSYFFISNILYFVSKSVKCILWQIFNEIVDNQDLYRNKDDFEKKL